MADVTGDRPRLRARLRTRLGTVRVRTTAAAVAVVGIALVVGAVGLVVALRHSLTDDLRTALELRATDVASVLEAGTPPDALAVDDGEESFVQVLDEDGRIVASSPNIAGQPSAARLDPGSSTTVEGLAIDDDEFYVVATGADTARGEFTVLAGRTLEVVEESTGFVRGVLVAGVPLLLLVVGVTAWRLVGRALAPVEGMRDEVERISADALHRRVPVPASDDEIARLATTMNRMLGRLEEARARERRLVSDASHELRSPVTAIRQHAEVAVAHPERASVEELAEVVLAEDLRLQQLVEDLLFLARADEDRFRVESRPVDLDDLVLEEVARLRATTALRVDATGVSAGRVAGDAGQLRRLLRNLADNAARHAGSIVALSIDGSGAGTGTVVLRVEDDGPGIPPEDRARVFERFVRLDEARAREGGGSGLGLSIAAEIARAHGGTVEITESPLGGARVEVRVPGLPD